MFLTLARKVDLVPGSREEKGLKTISMHMVDHAFETNNVCSRSSGVKEV